MSSIGNLNKNISNIKIGDVIYFKSVGSKNFGHAAIVSSIDYIRCIVTYAQHTGPKLFGNLKNPINNDEKYSQIVVCRIKDNIKIKKSMLV